MSSTSKKLTDYFDALITESNDIWVSFLDDNPYTYDGAFFMQDLLINHKVNISTFKNVENRWWTDFTLSFSLNRENKALHYINLFHPENSNQLIKTIHQILFKKKLPSLWLVVDSSWKESKLIPITNHLHIESKMEIKPYTLYQFVLTKTIQNR